MGKKNLVFQLKAKDILDKYDEEIHGEKKESFVLGNRGSNGYQDKSQHRNLTLEKRIVPPAGTRTRNLSIASPAL